MGQIKAWYNKLEKLLWNKLLNPKMTQPRRPLFEEIQSYKIAQEF